MEFFIDPKPFKERGLAWEVEQIKEFNHACEKRTSPMSAIQGNRMIYMPDERYNLAWGLADRLTKNRWIKKYDRGFSSYPGSPEEYEYSVPFNRPIMWDDLIWCFLNLEGNFYRSHGNLAGDHSPRLISMQLENPNDAMILKMSYDPNLKHLEPLV